jgi:tetratricopeptide (TPR) repeat protein
VHKFAGHLLFENGAFEDALQAYGQGEVGSTDLEVFLTRSKTYFLLGNFLRAAEDMQEAARLHPDTAELRFDQRVI